MSKIDDIIDDFSPCYGYDCVDDEFIPVHDRYRLANDALKRDICEAILEKERIANPPSGRKRLGWIGVDDILELFGVEE